MTNEEITRALQFLVGTRYVPAVKTYIAELTGRPRINGPGDFSSREIDLNRITLHTDSAGLITHVSFG